MTVTQIKGTDIVTNSVNYIRLEVCNHIVCEKLGNPGRVVQIDKSLFKSRKYNREIILLVYCM
ncbi:hypothetical protein A0H76_1154 [Hepatospora eriocheir]|uniref:Uncharacterized protein n=1 Tax=Hepatospora eriocheir TaxID=1081669 RepID=A0A1X0Q640_9MICR|nr:hypothetical protein A0H76_1154 [Hepatospora eriocheir]